MSAASPLAFTAFAGARRLATGALRDVVSAVKAEIERGADQPILIFDDATGAVVDVDFRGSVEDVLERLAAPSASGAPAIDGSGLHAAGRRGPGRPKLGVTAREVTLLPRHWDWLKAQPGGASVALRKLVDEARRRNVGKDRARRSQEAAYRFMSAMAGDRPGFEEAARALFAGNAARFDEMTRPWPRDIRDHAEKLAGEAFAGRRDESGTSRT